MWLIDGVLQLQPHMFTKTFLDNVIVPNAAGQPAPVAWFMTNVEHFIRPDIGVWNFLFVMLQMSIGIGILNKRTLRPALAVSFIWAFGVWGIGEGFGRLLTGTASPLMGAPGAVILYAALGVLVWPRSTTATSDGRGAQCGDVEPARHPVGVASSPAASGPLGAAGALGVWATLWIGFAILWLLPANRAAGAFSSSIESMTAHQPHWYASFLTTFAHHFTGIGPQTAWILAIVSLVIGIGPIVISRPTAFLAAGALLVLAFWVTGMAFGTILTGTGTDPNTAPVIVLLAIAMLPAVVPVRASVRTPLAALIQWNPLATGGVAAGVMAALLLGSTYPVAAAASASASRPTGTASNASVLVGTHSAGSAVSTSGQSSSMPGMTMSPSTPSSGATPASKGSDTASSMTMSGMGGLGVTDPTWKYTGPPLPTGETRLLSVIGTMTDKGHRMQTPDCTTKPTPKQVLGAVEYVQATSAAVAKYKVLATAKAAGYMPVTTPNFPVVHYVNPAYYNTQDILDPNHVDSLVYATTPTGPVLVAAMFLMPGMTTGPMPYGCLVQWHAHTNLCTSLSTGVIDGFMPCAPGSVHHGRTGYMTHVWQVPVSGGPLAIDPSTVMVVQAAIMAQQEGLAPITAPTGAVSYKTAGTAKIVGNF